MNYLLSQISISFTSVDELGYRHRRNDKSNWNTAIAQSIAPLGKISSGTLVDSGLKKSMKRLLAICLVTIGLTTTGKLFEQVRVNINIGKPVVNEPWYGTDDNYYYLPQQGVYYNTSRRVYIYPENGRWVYAPALPPSYGQVTWRRARHVRIHQRSPFDHDDDYRKKYHDNGKHDNGKHKGQEKHRRDDDRH